MAHVGRHGHGLRGRWGDGLRRDRVERMVARRRSRPQRRARHRSSGSSPRPPAHLANDPRALHRLHRRLRRGRDTGQRRRRPQELGARRRVPGIAARRDLAVPGTERGCGGRRRRRRCASAPVLAHAGRRSHCRRASGTSSRSSLPPGAGALARERRCGTAALLLCVGIPPLDSSGCSPSAGTWSSVGRCTGSWT